MKALGGRGGAKGSSFWRLFVRFGVGTGAVAVVVVASELAPLPVMKRSPVAVQNAKSQLQSRNIKGLDCL